MSLRTAVVAQFGRPSGMFGALAGFVMARRPSNRARNRWTVELLRLEADHAVLEIGCGPGLALADCVARAGRGRVVGLDHSPLMVAQARRRLASGAVELFEGGLAHPVLDRAAFDRAFSINVVQFLPDISASFRRIHGGLVAGGVAATTYQPRSRNPKRAAAIGMAERIEAAMALAGFGAIVRHELPLDPVPAICVIGVKG